jgi:hypothetical protein
MDTGSGAAAIFPRRELFVRLGGYREMPLLEDVDLLRRMRRHGRLAVVPRPVTTSARRFVERGIVRQQLLNGAILLAHAAGVSAARLARWYAVPAEQRSGQPPVSGGIGGSARGLSVAAGAGGGGGGRGAAEGMGAQVSPRPPRP